MPFSDLGVYFGGDVERFRSPGARLGADVFSIVGRRVIGPLAARDVSDLASDRIEELLAPFAALERVRPRRLDDPELLTFAGKSRAGLYRLIEAGVLVPERGPVPGSHCFLTLEQIARWRASRFTPANKGGRR
jgi:hypothetical protein